MTLVVPEVAANPVLFTRPRPLPPSHPTQLRRRLRTREVRLLSVVATGAPMTAVAQLLGVSDRTVRRRIRLLCEELGVSTPIEAVVWAVRQRLI